MTVKIWVDYLGKSNESYAVNMEQNILGKGLDNVYVHGKFFLTPKAKDAISKKLIDRMLDVCKSLRKTV